MSTVIAGFYNFGVTPNSGRIRQISSSGSTPTRDSSPVINDLTTDPLAFYFNGATGLRVLVVQRRYDSSFNQLFCYLSVYNPSASWAQTVAPNLTTAYKYSDNEELLNIYSITSPASPAGTLYGADYSASRIFKLIHSVSGSTESLALASDFYEFTPVSGATAYSVDTVFNTESSVNYIYAVAQQYTVSPAGSSDPNDYTYYNSIIVKLSASNLASVVDGPDASLAPNVFDLQLYGGNLYVTALGGPQWDEGSTTPTKWNEASRIQKVALSNLAVTNLVRPSTVAEASTNDMFDIRSLAILSDGTAYILTGSYNGSFAFYGRLWKTTIATLSAASNVLISSLSGVGTPIESPAAVFGYLWALLPAEDISMVWGMMGDELGVYNASGLVDDTIDAADASQWSTGSPAFNAISLAAPSVSLLKGVAAPATIKSARGFVHPLLASRAGVKPEEFEKFIKAYLGK